MTNNLLAQSKEIDPTFIVGGPYGVRHILHLFYKLFGVGNNTWTASIFLECSEKMAWMVRFTQAINARMYVFACTVEVVRCEADSCV